MLVLTIFGSLGTISGAKWDFWGKMRFLGQNEIFGEKWDFRGKMRFQGQNEISGAKWNFWGKVLRMLIDFENSKIFAFGAKKTGRYRVRWNGKRSGVSQNEEKFTYQNMMILQVPGGPQVGRVLGVVWRFFGRSTVWRLKYRKRCSNNILLTPRLNFFGPNNNIWAPYIE